MAGAIYPRPISVPDEIRDIAGHIAALSHQITRINATHPGLLPVGAPITRDTAELVRSIAETMETKP